MRRAGYIATFLLIAFAPGSCCYLSSFRPDYVRQEVPVFSASKEDESFVRDALRHLPSKVRACINTIHVVVDKNGEYLGKSTIINGETWVIRGRHYQYSSNIYLLKENITMTLVWHEALHAYFNWHRSAKRKWRRLTHKSGFIYSEKWKRSSASEFPQKGVLNRYGGTDREESACEWYEILMLVEVFGFTAPLREVKDDKKIYREMVLFFLEEELISKRTYRLALSALAD